MYIKEGQPLPYCPSVAVVSRPHHPKNAPALETISTAFPTMVPPPSFSVDVTGGLRVRVTAAAAAGAKTGTAATADAGEERPATAGAERGEDTAVNDVLGFATPASGGINGGGRSLFEGELGLEFELPEAVE